MVASVIKDVFEQIDPTSEGKLGFDSVKAIAYIVLAISAPILDNHTLRIPPRIFKAAAFLGRISHALGDIMDQRTVLAYSLQNSKHNGLSDLGFNPEGAPCSPTPGSSVNDILAIASLKTPAMIYEQGQKDDAIESIKTILSKVQDIWPLIQSGVLHEVLRTLRFCKEALGVFTYRTNKYSGALAFTLQYLKIMKLVVKVWNLISSKRSCPRRIGEWEFLLGKLERGLKELRSRFIGFSKEEERHILELMLVAYTLRLSNGEVCCHLTTMRKLSIIASNIEHLPKEEFIEPSTFVHEVQRSLPNLSTITPKAPCSSPDFRKLLKSFTLGHLEISEKT